LFVSRMLMLEKFAMRYALCECELIKRINEGV